MSMNKDLFNLLTRGFTDVFLQRVARGGKGKGFKDQAHAQILPLALSSPARSGSSLPFYSLNEMMPLQSLLQCLAQGDT